MVIDFVIGLAASFAGSALWAYAQKFWRKLR